ncbi:MAG: hypothetical protein AAFQ40_04030 [Cyanobacteria bacterium J06623_5]
MNFSKLQKRLGVTSLTIGGLLFASHSLSKPSVAQTTAPSCPGIFYQEPFTTRVAAPAGCPLTEYQRSLQGNEPIDPSLADQPDSLEALETAETGELGVNSSGQDIKLRSLQLTVLDRDNGGDQPNTIEQLR